MAFFNKLKQFGQGLTLGALDTTARILPTLAQHRFQREERRAAEERGEVRDVQSEARRMFEQGRFEEGVAILQRANMTEEAAEMENSIPEAKQAQAEGRLREFTESLSGKVAASTGKGGNFLLRTPQGRGRALESISGREEILAGEIGRGTELAERAGVPLPPILTKAQEEVERLRTRSRAINSIDLAAASIDTFNADKAKVEEGLESYFKAQLAANGGDETRALAATTAYRLGVDRQRETHFLNSLHLYSNPSDIISDALTYGLSERGQDLALLAATQLERTQKQDVTEREANNFKLALFNIDAARTQAAGLMASGEPLTPDIEAMLLSAADILEANPNTQAIGQRIHRDPLGYLTIGMKAERLQTKVEEWVAKSLLDPDLVKEHMSANGINMEDIKAGQQIPVERIRKYVRENLFGFAPGTPEGGDGAITMKDIAERAIERLEGGTPPEEVIEKAQRFIKSPEEREEFELAVLEGGHLMDLEEGSVVKIPWRLSDLINAPAILAILTDASQVLADPEKGRDFLSKVNIKLNFLRSKEARQAALRAISENSLSILLTSPIPGLAPALRASGIMEEPELTPRQQQLFLQRQR